MTTVVVDASVAAKWLIREDGTEAALRLREPDYELVCPDLLFLEVASVVWRKVRANELDAGTGRRLVAAILEAPLEIEPTVALLPAAWEIARRHDRTVYDAVYLALAVALDTRLVTADRRLVRALAAGNLASHIVELASLPGRG